MADRARHTPAEVQHAPGAHKTTTIAHSADRLITYEMNLATPELNLPVLVFSALPDIATSSGSDGSCDTTQSGMVCSIDQWVVANKTNEEALSYCATILLAMVGVVALTFAYSQANHAKKARLADTLIGLSKSLDGLSKFQEHIETCLSAQNANTMQQQRAAISGVLDGTIPYARRDEVVQSVDTLLSFIEDVGLLCRAGYVEKKDIFDMMGAIILTTLEISMGHIERQRQTYGRNTYYANALWLYRKVRSARRFAVYSHGPPVPSLCDRFWHAIRYRLS